ncbi:heavy metal-binding domain-containing protein [Alicyclobacillus sp. SO9]|uniref:heavy metal-binding domain-containing protein n=1 Tax=Alicyclobacillus sp. SO9 TaxID=2665646 RepID=UPI0018E8C978|nr:heavy metal-binding domain-containing protein [Alicyclobacillus sp. SO9]QQE79010.1 heavy metal-binding domain-containing protein [Alicyclobacillus sp. SO9]
MSNNNQGLPQHALERLQGLRSQGNPGGVFTSDLSVNEYLLVREAGFEPIGMVMGSSVYHIGVQVGRWGQNMEMDNLTQAMYHARELAMSRMEEEADELGADGIVGVRLTINRYEWGTDLAEFIAIGTAVVARPGTKLPDSPHGFRTFHNKPFTSDLSGQDFWTLLQSGYRPLSMVMGTCVYHVAHQGFLKSIAQVGQNQEQPNFTQALYDARELAMERMQTEAHEEKSEGIVGVRIDEGSYGWASHIIEFFAVGTAVIALRANHEIQTPNLVLSLNDK